MFSRILIANRGEIACRIIKTAQSLGIHCIAVYSDADVNAQHVKLADEAYNIGPAKSSESYLNATKILAAAQTSGAQAIHPGYGFLSENAQFAALCVEQGLTFIGPSAQSIAAMGSKSAAKSIMSKANVPLVPGYHGADQTSAGLKAEAIKCGFPLLLKAVAGGGGKGMRVVESIDAFDTALSSAQREAKNAFGNSDMLLERYMTKTRHIEVQVFFDSHGNGLYLSQRDCSIQRRHQKIIEEAPASGISESIIKTMGMAALDAAKAIDYLGAGTVEFLYNEDTSFYFMEMNTRLQVEHPVTEMITGIDLVDWQLQIASGKALPLTQAEVLVTGHAIECRVYAEDPRNDFLPATGILHYLREPLSNRQTRIDTGVVEGDEVSVYYDPMIAKIITLGADRQQAIAKMAQALKQYHIAGVKNNLSFLHSIMINDAFKCADVDTNFIPLNKSRLLQSVLAIDETLAIASCAKLLANAQQFQTQSAHSSNQGFDPFLTGLAWRLNHLQTQSVNWINPEIELSATNDKELAQYSVSVTQLQPTITLSDRGNQAMQHFKVSTQKSTYYIQAELEKNHLRICINGHKIKLGVYFNQSQVTLFYCGTSLELQIVKPESSLEESHTEGQLTAPMNGRVIAVLAKVGQKIGPATPIMIVEAMKMEHSILSPAEGIITDIFFSEDSLVTEGDTLIAMEHAPKSESLQAPS